MAQLNSGYSSSEVMAMQRDAIERVREMQRRSQEKLQQTSIPTPPPVQAQPPAIAVQTHVPSPKPILPEPPKAPPVHHYPRPNPSPPPTQSSPIQSLLGGILGDMDGEKIMLLLLIYLLAKEGADQMLILALLYLIL